VTRHIALNFGRLQHFNDGLGEFSRQLAAHLVRQAERLREAHDWQFHFFLPQQWHGLFGDAVTYHPLSWRMRLPYRGSVRFDIWHELHQHLRYRPPVDARCNLITLHDLNYVHAKTGLSLWRHSRRHRQCLFRAQRIIAISEHSRADLLKHFPTAPPSVVIHNGVSDLTRAARTSVPRLEGAPFFLHISRMSPNKNVDSLLALAKAWPEKQFVLVGPANRHVLRHRAHCSEHDLRNVLILTDVDEAVKAWLYANCQLFLFPSKSEGFGLPPIEAMYFGKPVVVARRTSLPEICGSGAFYWDDFAPAAMRSVIEKVLRQVESGQWPAQRVRDHAMRYQWEQVAERYLQVYAGHIGNY
jgi:glycosyltransferase involved in cell wall biosynthesis